MACHPRRERLGGGVNSRPWSAATVVGPHPADGPTAPSCEGLTGAGGRLATLVQGAHLDRGQHGAREVHDMFRASTLLRDGGCGREGDRRLAGYRPRE